jgi:hypothetical protein
MFKILFLLSLIFASSLSMASPLDQMMTIKERLRLSLWVEGVEERPMEKQNLKPKRELPEEIERALRKL